MPVLRLMVIFMFYPLETGAAEVTVCRAQTARPRLYLLPHSWDMGCDVEVALLLKWKGLGPLLT